MRYWAHSDTFVMGDLKEIAMKPLEEASEAREAVERWAKSRGCDGTAKVREAMRSHAVYECCDTLQATFNLLAALGVTQAELDATMGDVRRRNEERGRYGSDSEGR